MGTTPGLQMATSLILAGLDHHAVVRGLKVALGLTDDEAEAAWVAADKLLDRET
jgi:hypothetical protein